MWPLKETIYNTHREYFTLTPTPSKSCKTWADCPPRMDCMMNKCTSRHGGIERRPCTSPDVCLHFANSASCQDIKPDIGGICRFDNINRPMMTTTINPLQVRLQNYIPY